MIHMTFSRLIFLLSMTCLLAACGQRGPLYLPEAPDELETELEDEDVVHDGSFESAPDDEP